MATMEELKSKTKLADKKLYGDMDLKQDNSLVAIDKAAEKVLAQVKASAKAPALPLHYKNVNRSRSGYSFKTEIIRPDRFGNFYPKDEEQKKFFDSLVSVGKMLKEGE